MSATTSNDHAAPAEHAHKAWKTAAWITGALLLVAAGVAFLVTRPRTAAPPWRFELAPATRGPLQARITASGTLSALITVQVGSQVSGKIQTLGADFNSVVHKHQVIATIDPSFYKAALQQTRANLLAAKANTAKAKSQLEDAERIAGRNRQLVAQKLISQQDADSAETAVHVDRSQVEAAQAAEVQAQAALDQAKINLDYCTIASPIDGVVISRNVDVGQTVAAALQAPTIFTIAQDLTHMQVDTNIAEADVGHLAPGMKASFTVDAYPSEEFNGVIREVRNAPQTVQNVVTYDAVIDVANPALKLKPGMTANVTAVFADRADALKVPNAALRFRAPEALLSSSPAVPNVKGDHRVVWVMKGAMPTPVAVRIGVSDGSATEVLEGLTAGDKVVTEAVSTSKGGPGSFGRVF
ncbi:MAG: efflux RND transporter periplasmic adaptor subunit [Deltaproteobacteria bacterium]|nr:efflux RND transporter periplasmic adaptor subunit [Deltaproteobacteria bacterium]